MKPINPEQTAEQIISFIKTTFAKTGFMSAVIGVSGGVDSAVSLLLTIRALGKEQVFPVLLPYGPLSTQSTIDAMTLIEKSGVPIGNIVRIDIKPASDVIMGASGSGFDNIRRGNIMSRVRMTILFDQAKKRRALVVGTENRSELLLGYFTRFGDAASDIEPVQNLYKTQIFELAKFLGVTDAILSKAPSAELWGGQTDELEFGFTYKEADVILSFLFDEKKSVDEIIGLGFDKTLVHSVKLRVENNAFKHSLPIIQQ
jgi:NAD+ synthase